jgi:hypothetical protein
MTQEIWIDGWLVDTKIIYGNTKFISYTWWNAPWNWWDVTDTWTTYWRYIPWAYLLNTWWIGVDPIGWHSIGLSNESISWNDEYQEITILRTKWNLNVKWKKIQFRFYNSSLAGKVRLKNLAMLVEVLPGLSNNLTI